MEITPTPEFGNVVGLRRLNGAAVERVRTMDTTEADKGAWIGQLTCRAGRRHGWTHRAPRRL